MKMKKREDALANPPLRRKYFLYLLALFILAILGLGVYSFTGDVIRGVRPGTFAAGDYVFPNSTSILGKIGIGTGNPYAPLHIKGGFTQQILERDDNSQQWSFLIQANKDLSLRDQNKLETLFDFTKDGNFIVRNGRIGIKNSVPSGALDVDGVITSSGKVIADSAKPNHLLLKTAYGGGNEGKNGLSCLAAEEGIIKRFDRNTHYSYVKQGQICFCLKKVPQNISEAAAGKQDYRWKCLAAYPN